MKVHIFDHVFICCYSVYQVWSLTEGSCLMTLTGHHDAVTCLNLTFDSRKVISGSLDHNLKFWDLLNGKVSTYCWFVVKQALFWFTSSSFQRNEFFHCLTLTLMTYVSILTITSCSIKFNSTYHCLPLPFGIKQLMTDPNRNSSFCFPSTLNA